ncbi:MAG: 2-phosphosulfolactate phosphatase [Thermodesulfobacteriota bacterium]
MKIDLFLTAGTLTKADVKGKAVVIIDVLRSSTSICAALENGAKGIIPVDGPGQAGEIWTKIGPDTAILAGERDGVKIENFSLGNSPGEFTAEAVAEKLVIMSTTNGTPIFEKAASAKLVLACGLVNIGTVVDRLVETGLDLVIVCSGRNGGFSIEDTLCGGMIIDLLERQHEVTSKLNDAASLARLLYRSNQENVHDTIASGEHGQYLQEIGFEADLETASRVDSIDVLPVLTEGRLVNMNDAEGR